MFKTDVTSPPGVELSPSSPPVHFLFSFALIFIRLINRFSKYKSIILYVSPSNMVAYVTHLSDL